MAKITLTEARVRALRSRKTAYDTRDGKLKGFGVRVLPSGGKRFFIHCQHRGERIWKIVGATNAMGLVEARKRAATMLAAIRRGREPLASAENVVFENVADEVFHRYALRWKPGTLRVNRCYLRNQILPHFAGRQIADIDRQDVQNWFASLRATPVAADRSMPVLSVIMGEAEAMCLRPEGSNPCRGIRRYRRKGRERFLSDDEIRRLSARLSAHGESRPLSVGAIRLLLLTGCRKEEILTLRWSDYRDGHLFLRDGKTGPRTVWLSQPARNVLDGLERTSRWVFPALREDRPRSGAWLHWNWCRVREEGGAEAGPQAAPARRQGPQTRSLARAGAGSGRRRPCRRDPQPNPARSQRKEREGGAGAGRRPRCLARLRRQPLLSARRSGARHPAREHQRRRRRAGPRRALHIQTVNSRHSQIKGFLRGFRGIATKYLDSYLRWFHLIELGDQPSPRACLKAAMARPCLRFAN